MIAYIPARGGSKRIPRKNIKLLDGKPIISHVIDNLRELDFISAICVSTDDQEIKDIAESFGAVTLGIRPPELSDDKTDIALLIHKDVERYAIAHDNDYEVLFVYATAALIPADIYTEAYSVYEKEKPELLMSCMEYPAPIYFAMVEKDDGYWKVLYPDKLEYNTQDLPKTVVDSGLFYFFNLNSAKRYQDPKLVDKLLPFVVDPKYAVDVDSPEEWYLLEMKLQILKNWKKKETNDNGKNYQNRK